MNGTSKFIVGAIATSLMAMATHSWGGMGAGFLDRLKSESAKALGNAGGNAGANGISVDFVREPSLQRIAILSGPADEATRAHLLAAVKAVPGVKDARWADDGQVAAPTAAETPATKEEVVACQTTVNNAIAGKTIQFETGSAEIRADSSTLIDAVSAALAPCEGTVIDVAGHTDARGNPASNMRLSEARANSVVAALVAKGVPIARLTAHGFGATQPKVQGSGAEADAANRRIEFTVAAAGATAPAAATPAPAEGGQ